jgi:acyl dehydratase
MLTIKGIEGLCEWVGRELGVSSWHQVTQAHIDAFARATEDFEWIHVDPERARQSPYGVTIAHGLYTLSIGPKFVKEIYTVEDVPFGLNYGYNRVRWITPVRVDARVRMRARLKAVDDDGDGVITTVEQVFEIEGEDRPALVAEWLAKYFAAVPASP